MDEAIDPLYILFAVMVICRLACGGFFIEEYNFVELVLTEDVNQLLSYPLRAGLY